MVHQRLLNTLLLTFLFLFCSNAVNARIGDRERVRFDSGWRFHLGDLESAQTDLPVASRQWQAIRPDFDDRSWRVVDLPHDFVVEGTIDRKADVSHGFLPANVSWYRKTFHVPPSDPHGDKQTFLDSDGIYRNSDVWVNGRHVGNHPSGYTSFRYDITRYVKPGARNVIAVRVDARHFEGWWYEGGGIYRHVWLVKTNPIHVAHWGTFVTSVVNGLQNGTAESADVTIRTVVQNDGVMSPRFNLRSRIETARGKLIAEVTSGDEILPGKTITFNQRVRIPKPLLWSIDKPDLYRLVTTVEDNPGFVVDRYITPFGIRTIRFDAEKGFFLNGEQVKLKGTCNHQDFAGVGVALPDRLFEYRIERLKAIGSNAYRCAHNPPAPELLETCDRLGMLVMDENRHLGDTYADHSPSGTGYSDLSDLKSMVLRDRNHPSIIMWSMCNEENLQGSEEGAQIFKAMKEAVLHLDSTRPITCAMNGGWGKGISLVEDLMGCNYHPEQYDDYHRRFPAIPAYGSETASTVSTRGVYSNDKARGYVSAYDVNAPYWAQLAEVAWPAIAKRQYMAGSFAWTGFDYRGEPTPYDWPCVNSHFGILDMCGFPKDNFYYYLANWTDGPIVHLLPHWNWPGREGQKVAVWCYSNCDEVELFLNGKTMGRKRVHREGHLEWDVDYAPGRLEAVGYRGGFGYRREVVETTGPPARIALRPYRRRISSTGGDVSAVWVTVEDAQGRVVPTANNLVQFHVAGPGRIIGVSNGDPSCHEPDKATRRSTFGGWCLVLIQSTGRGSIRIMGESKGLASGSATITADPFIASLERIASD